MQPAEMEKAAAHRCERPSPRSCSAASVLAGRRADGAAAFALAFRTLRFRRADRVVPVRRRLRLLAVHDVLDLRLVDRLVLHERVGHRVELVEIALEYFLGALVVDVDETADLLVDG